MTAGCRIGANGGGWHRSGHRAGQRLCSFLTLCTIFSHWVPLPAAGAPMIMTFNGPALTAYSQDHSAIRNLCGRLNVLDECCT